MSRVGVCEVSYAQHKPSSFHFLLSADQDVGLSTPSPLRVCLRATTSHHGDHGLNLWNVSHLNATCFCLRDAMIVMSLHSDWNPKTESGTQNF